VSDDDQAQGPKPLPPHVEAEVRRILNGEANRPLDEQLEADQAGTSENHPGEDS
jgi:hypothetical protein